MYILQKKPYYSKGWRLEPIPTRDCTHNLYFVTHTSVTNFAICYHLPKYSLVFTVITAVAKRKAMDSGRLAVSGAG